MKTEELNGHLLKPRPKTHGKLMAGTHTPSPVKRVEIPKPNRGRNEAAPECLERFQARVREKWRSGRSLTSNQLRDAWRQYVRGWSGCYQLAENRRPIFRLEGWIRRHIRKCFWLRWHEPEGRERRLRNTHRGSPGLTG